MSLENKLTANFLQYQNAAEYLRRNNQTFAGRSPVTREQLNDYLSVGGRLSLTRSERTDLKKLQDKVVGKQQRRNEAASRLDLTKLTNSQDREDFAKEIPKGALLHVHPSGTRTPDTVRKILETLDPKVDVMTDVIRSRKPHQSVSRDDVDTFKDFPVGKFSALKNPKFPVLKNNQDTYIGLFFLQPDKRYPFSRFDLLFLVDDIFKPPTLPKPDLDDARAWKLTYDRFAEQCEELNVSYVEFTEDLEKLLAEKEKEVMQV